MPHLGPSNASNEAVYPNSCRNLSPSSTGTSAYHGNTSSSTESTEACVQKSSNAPLPHIEALKCVGSWSEYDETIRERDLLAENFEDQLWF
ncbi:hypothetical protein GLAREA_08879 [Glarea lozoyensis ATCC 20868]|uniref:Uncharacterized protein n=1 Tax=Glarea lozoyensis (strain ATCC 20868 / MF5171) TaxID=1116229 RepID=S3DXR9_GLAL2|nr:uncharacterized protein GLAREA_08879 [Glarea lozoyensis ATCC 20868]EPE36716.1 hypothetical protein GLAREA_08879 [Glarea lozoyensis ATCC 20868]